MKNLLYILFAVTLFTACSSDDDNDNSENIKITNITIDSKAQVDQNYIIAYKEDNTFKKISTFYLRSGATKLITIENLNHSRLYLFTDYASFSQNGKDYWRIIDIEYDLKANEDNNIEIPALSINNTRAVDISDSSQFPKN